MCDLKSRAMAESLNTPLATMSLVTPAINSRYSFSRFLRAQIKYFKHTDTDYRQLLCYMCVCYISLVPTAAWGRGQCYMCLARLTLPRVFSLDSVSCRRIFKCNIVCMISLCILRRARVVPCVNSLGLQAQLYCHVKEFSSPLISWYHNDFICLHMAWLSWKTCTGSG